MSLYTRPVAPVMLPDVESLTTRRAQTWSDTRHVGRPRGWSNWRKGSGRSGRRLAGLDGLRAIAVMSVVVFHLDAALVPGGFLGVDVFFVISGFLITNLIATEVLTTRRFRLGSFYLRRARRLLPTVLVLLAVVLLVSRTIWRDQLATVHGGVISSLAYVTNWWLIADHQSYFVTTGRPTMVQHLWSLAIEEQYYLVWSLVLGLLVAGIASRGRLAGRLRLVTIVAAVLAGVSTAVMAVLAIRSDLPYGGSTSRVYFGSDTHTMGLFLGSAAGAWLAVRRSTTGPGRSALGARRRRDVAWLTDLIGVVAVAVTVDVFFHVDEFSPGLYRGGFLAFDACVLVAVLCATRPVGLLGRLLDVAPMRWLGQRSYAIYIWHWPVVVVTRPGVDLHGPTWLINVARLTLILALAHLSYRFVETPLRARSRAPHPRHPEPAVGRPDAVAARGGSGALPAVAAAVVSGVALLALAHPVSGVARPTAKATTPPTSHARVTSPHAPPSVSSSSRPVARHATGARPTPHPATAARPALSGFGDSVLLGASADLRAGTSRLRVDAVEGRQAYDVLTDISRAATAGELAPNVLIHIGNNGIISPKQLSSTLAALHDRRRVVMFTDRVPRDWQDPNNQIIRDTAARYANVRVVDWHGVAGQHPDWLYLDGTHLTPAGRTGYANLVLQALR